MPIDKVQGENRANAMMKAETKAKRRVTLSVCGLGMLDETEAEPLAYTPPRTVVESPERIAGTHAADQRGPLNQEAPQDAGKATNGTTAPVVSGDATKALALSNWKPGRAGTAAAVAPSGGPITPDQTKAIHTLLSRVGNITDEAYRKQVAVYRQADGTSCAIDGKGTSKLLSKDQASHLISRLEAKCDRQDQRAGAGVDLDAAVPSRNGSPTTHNFGKSTASIDDLFQKAFNTDDEQADWLRGLWAVEHVKELDQKETEMALQLLICMSQGSDVYDTALTQARERGLVR